MEKIIIPHEISTQNVRVIEDRRKTEIDVAHAGEVSDGYHTFDELYDHRITLFIALCRNLEKIANEDDTGGLFDVWRSKAHHDGSVLDGWFTMGIGKENGQQISYHLPISRWEETDFAETLEKAPEWDGHTPNDVLERLKAL